MVEQLEARYTLFDSIEEMLKPESLSEILSKPITGVECRPMNGHNGLAGGRLSYVETNDGRLVLKQMAIDHDWIMYATDDRLCRSITLWQYGLLDQLCPHPEHKMLACSRDGGGWAILMRDLTGSTFAWDKPISADLVPVFLDVMARLHATFWNDPLLNDSRLGLSDIATLLAPTTLAAVQKPGGPEMGVLPEWIRGGWEVMEELLDPDVFAQMSDLVDHPLPLFEALARYPHTLLHGDYRSENFAQPESGCPVVIDWQQATRSLMTIDLAWFANWVIGIDEMSREEAIDYYRRRLEAYLDTVFEDASWKVMVDLGFFVDALRSTCFVAYWHKHSDDLENRRRNGIIVKQRNQQVRDAMRRL